MTEHSNARRSTFDETSAYEMREIILDTYTLKFS